MHALTHDFSGVQARSGLGGKLGRKPSSEDLEAPLTDSGNGSPSSSGRLERRAATALGGGGAYLSEVQLNQARPRPRALGAGVIHGCQQPQEEVGAWSNPNALRRQLQSAVQINGFRQNVVR